MKRLLIAMAVAALGAALMPTAAGAAGRLAYDSIPGTLPGNVPSHAFQATQTSEFGDGVSLEPGTPRRLQSVRVILSSWGCQSGTWNGGDCLTTAGATFTHPITLNVYEMSSTGSVGPLVASKTQAFNIRYRPSANDVRCTGADAGKWFKKGTCFNGFAQSIKFGFAGDTLPVDRNVIWTVAFNTSGYGETPLGYNTACSQTTEGCPYDSLNVGLNTSPNAPYVGTDVQPDGAYLDSATAGQYCNSGTVVPGTLQLDDGCWDGFVPMAEITTKRAA